MATLVFDSETDLDAPRRLTAEEFNAMWDAEVLTDDRLELLDGVIFPLSPLYLEHARAAEHFARALEPQVAAMELAVDRAVSVRMGAHDEPLPDVIVWRSARLRGAIPAERVRLIVEVSGWTQYRDLKRKPPIYARGGLPEYWVADLSKRIVHQFWAPLEDRYTLRRTIMFGQPVTSETLPGVIVATSGLD